MTVHSLTTRLEKAYHSILIHILPDVELKNLLRTTPFQDIRRAIWVRLGNQIGEDAYINNNVTLLDSSQLSPNVILGKRVALSPNITFITCSSPNDSLLKNLDYAKRFLRTAAIAIGDDTWIGAGCVIQPGVKIGKRCIIGSCSNVTHDIPDDCLAYGNPAKVIRRLAE